MAEVNANQLQEAIARLGPVRVRISGSDDTTDAVILYPGTIAGCILQYITAPHGYCEPSHAAAAEQAITASTYSYQKWGEGASGAWKSAMWEMERAKVHATLTLAAVLAGRALFTCDQSEPADFAPWTCTERLGHDDRGWHYDPLASKWWRRTPDGVEAVKDPRDRTGERNG